MALVDTVTNAPAIALAITGRDVSGWYPLVDYTVDAGRMFAAAREFKLLQNYPNPFNAGTTIEYQIMAETNVTVRIFDVLGRLVRTLVHEQQPAGYYRIRWDGTDQAGLGVSSGVYLYKIDTGDGYVEVRRMLFLR